MGLAIHKPALGNAATAFLGKKHRMLINGKWVEARSGESFPVEDPATQAHSVNESLDLGVLERAATAEALLLANLVDRD